MSILRRAEELAEQAQGNIKSFHLTGPNTKLASKIKTDTPLIEYLLDAEQPHYIFGNTTKGLRFEHPNWTAKKTRYNGSGLVGHRYLIITDERVLFILGDTDVGDTVEEFPYEELVGSSTASGIFTHRLTIEHRDGRYISFFEDQVTIPVDEQGDPPVNYLGAASEYITKQIERAAAGLLTEPNRSGPVSPSGETRVFDPDAEGGDSAATRIHDSNMDDPTNSDRTIVYDGERTKATSEETSRD